MQQGFSSFSFSQLNISNLFLITEYNECTSNPCQFGGICNDRVNRFECQCPFARVGTRCGKFLNCMNLDLRCLAKLNSTMTRPT